MTRMTARIVMLTAMALGLLAEEGQAWGPRARKAIAAMSMQVITDSFSNAFRPSGVTGPNYERDVLGGAIDGYTPLQKDIALNSDEETVQAIGSEIQLLREARKYGQTAFFSYRMGVLSTLVAEVVLPFGFAWSPSDEAIQKQVFSDIDAHLDEYRFMPSQKRRTYIRNTAEYFKGYRAFYSADKRLIADDYQSGSGYKGFLSKGGQAYFTRAVEAVSDVWYTILADSPDGAQVPASKRAVAWYFVDEIQYLLTVKKDFRLAEKTYDYFQTVNPGLAAAYEKLGDLFCDFGTAEGVERGVREWRTAHNLGGPERTRVAAKLAAHYLKEGKGFLDKASRPDAEDTDLSNALKAFNTAFEFNPVSKEAADLIQQTNTAIYARQQRLQTTVELVATAEKVSAEAEKARMNGDYAGAISTFRQAITIYEAVSDEFRDQAKIAKEGSRKLSKSITDVINEVLDRASEAIDEGDRAKDEKKFPDAIAAYQKVTNIVAVIPDDEGPAVGSDKQEIIDLAARKIDEAKTAQIRYDAAKAEAEAAAARGAAGRQGGGAPAAAPAAAAPAAAPPAAAPGPPATGRRGRGRG